MQDMTTDPRERDGGGGREGEERRGEERQTGAKCQEDCRDRSGTVG